MLLLFVEHLLLVVGRLKPPILVIPPRIYYDTTDCLYLATYFSDSTTSDVAMDSVLICTAENLGSGASFFIDLSLISIAEIEEFYTIGLAVVTTYSPSPYTLVYIVA